MIPCDSGGPITRNRSSRHAMTKNGIPHGRAYVLGPTWIVFPYSLLSTGKFKVSGVELEVLRLTKQQYF